MTGRQPANVLGIVLAGGEGKRLWPLTADRAKPAVPFGGNYRLIDFVLSNMVNGGLHRICVLTQYKSHSLDRHISQTWRLSSVLGQYITTVPAQQRLGRRWYTGSADALLQSQNLIFDERPDHIAVFGADHVYRMDPAQMIDAHVASGAGVTVAGIRVPRLEAREFGCIAADPSGRITEFLEKPADPPSVADDPSSHLRLDGQLRLQHRGAARRAGGRLRGRRQRPRHGRRHHPAHGREGGGGRLRLRRQRRAGRHRATTGYWRDVGTIDSYYDAHRDLISVLPVFNLYNQGWPIRTAAWPLAPAKFVEGGIAQDSVVGAGSIISGAIVRRSVISPDVRIDKDAEVSDSVVMPGARVGRGAIVRGAILDKNVQVPDGVLIGVDSEADRKHYTVSPGGIAVLGKGLTAS